MSSTLDRSRLYVLDRVMQLSRDHQRCVTTGMNDRAKRLGWAITKWCERLAELTADAHGEPE